MMGPNIEHGDPPTVVSRIVEDFTHTHTHHLHVIPLDQFSDWTMGNGMIIHNATCKLSVKNIAKQW